MDRQELKKIAHEVRKGIITSIYSAKAGHPGGSLSAADLFVYLYFEEMHIDPKQPMMEERDRFVLSKGHTAPGLYAALARLFSDRRFRDASPCRKLSSGTSGYEMCSGCRHVYGVFGPGAVCGGRYGACSKA